MISCAGVFRPLVGAIELFNEAFGQKPFKVSQEDDVVLAVEVDPATVAVLGEMALHLAGRPAIEDVIE